MKFGRERNTESGRTEWMDCNEVTETKFVNYLISLSVANANLRCRKIFKLQQIEVRNGNSFSTLQIAIERNIIESAKCASANANCDYVNVTEMQFAFRWFVSQLGHKLKRSKMVHWNIASNTTESIGLNDFFRLRTEVHWKCIKIELN